MANSKQNGKQSGGKKGGNGGQTQGAPKGAACAIDGMIYRKDARKDEDRLEATRQALKSTGEFYVKKNDGRKTNIFELAAGVIGEYAIPGGNQPSVHLRVAEAGTPEKPQRVIYFDGAHEGSGLPGNLSTETYIPLWSLSKDEYTSRLDGVREETQTRVWKFLVKTIDAKRAEAAKENDANEFAEMFSKSDKDLRGIRRGQPGLYGMQKGDAVVIFSVFLGKKVSVKVLKSALPELPASGAFLPIEQLRFPELRQVTDDVTYKAQLAIHGFLKPILDVLVDDEPTETSRPNLRIVPTSPAPVAKEETGKVSVKDVMNKGATGVVVFTEGEQSLTVNVHDKQTPKGPIRFFEVVAKSGFSESSVLSIEVGTYVTAEQLIAQAVSKAEAAGLPPKSVGTKIALIAFMMKALKGIRFCKKPSEVILPGANLKLVAA